MPPISGKPHVDVVELDNSDDEENAAPVSGQRNLPPVQIGMARKSQGATMTLPPSQQQKSGATTMSTDQNLEFRSFWKAGNHAVRSTSFPAPASGQLEHARVNPKFLHSNATCHTWAFGAIAELMDNAVDEIHNGATFVKIDKFDIIKDNSPALVFQDDGGGMDPEGMRKCMSLGYSSKKSKETIGQYGNGFKTSTMRLGSDAIVFSRTKSASKATQSVGLLSYTFLRKTGQDDVIIPMIDFDLSGSWVEPIIYGSQDDWSSNLELILEWSPFASKEELLQQFEDIGPHGTKVLIYNLWLNDEGIYELSFDVDNEDILLRDDTNSGGLSKVNKRVAELQSHISYRRHFSLRAYTSILYLRKFTSFNIILRGKPVQQLFIADELNYSKVFSYKPVVVATSTSKEAAVETTIGFIKEAPAVSVSGFNVYHKNRLIRPFWKVTPDGSSKGHGVVGVLEANFIEPSHDKQGFETSSQSVRLEAKLKQYLNDYWKNYCHLLGHQPPGFAAKFKQNELHSRPEGNISLQKAIPVHQEVVDLENETHNEGVLEDGNMSVDQICEENIQLFMRCEEFAKKEIEMNEEILKLEKELEDAKKKRDQLAFVVEKKRKRTIVKQTQNVS